MKAQEDIETMLIESQKRRNTPKPTPEELESMKILMGTLTLNELDEFFADFIVQEYREFCSRKFVLPRDLGSDETLINVFESVWQMGRDSKI